MLLPVESLKFLDEKSRAAAPRIVTCDREPPHVYYVADCNGNLTRQIACAPPDRHAAGDIDTLVRVALADYRPEDAETSPNTPVIWYTRDGVIAVLDPDDSDFPARCTLALSPSPQMKTLAFWDGQGKASLKQAEFILLLRTLFAGCAPATLLPAVRKLQTKRGAEVNAAIEQGKVSMSRAIVAEMTGASAIPERITLEVPAFAQAAVAVAVRVTVELDPSPEDETFTLVVHPGAIENAMRGAEEVLEKRIRAALKDSPIPVYHGKP